MLGQTQFMGSKFRIFGGLGWVCCSMSVDEPGFRRVRSSVFLDFDLGSNCFWPNRFKVWASCRGSKGFEIQFWWANLGSIKFEVHPVKFEAVRNFFIVGFEPTQSSTHSLLTQILFGKVFVFSASRYY